jgi:hypothetical protein
VQSVESLLPISTTVQPSPVAQPLGPAAVTGLQGFVQTLVEAALLSVMAQAPVLVDGVPEGALWAQCVSFRQNSRHCRSVAESEMQAVPALQAIPAPHRPPAETVPSMAQTGAPDG